MVRASASLQHDMQRGSRECCWCRLPQVRIIAKDTVEQQVLEMQRWKRQHGQAPAATAAAEFDDGHMLRFFGDM